MTLTFGIGQSELPWHNSRSRCTPDDVTRIAQEVKSLGANSIRMSCLWIELDPHRNHNYVWTDLDLAINAVHDAGLDILLIVEPRRSALPIGISPSQSLATDYGKLCGAIAKRYGDKIRWYEIGNEVNSLSNFGAPNKPSEYLWFLRAAHDNIKAVSPNATVLAGALMAIGTGWSSLAPVEWVQKLYDSNPQDAFDGISMHPYARDGSDYTPQVPTADNWSLKNIDAIRSIMDDNGDTDKLIYCTEWGFDSMTSPSGLSTTDVELEAEQAHNVELLWNFLKPYADSGIIYDTTWIFMYRDWEEQNKKSANHYGMVHFDYVRKPEWTFVRGLAGDGSIALPAATATAQAWAPVPEYLEAPGTISLSRATATAKAFPPIVSEHISLPAATATAQSTAPMITVAVSEVEWVSTGTGDRDQSNTSSTTVSGSHNVTAETGRLLLIGIVISTSNFRDWTNYTPVVESVVNGVTYRLLRLASGHIGSASIRHGSIHWYGLYHPPVGLHEWTVTASDATTNFTALSANSVLLRDAAGYGSNTYNTSSEGGNTPRVKVTSVLDHLTLALFGTSHQLTGFNQDVLYNQGSSVLGDGDYILIGDAPGANSVTFQDTTVGLTIFAALGLDIPNIVAPQADISLPAASATAKAWVPDVSAAGVIAVPTATATSKAWPPTVGEHLELPSPTATGKAWPPVVVTENILAPAATATAKAWPPSLSEPPLAPPAAAATAKAWPPLVGEKLSLPTATATTAKAWPPIVGERILLPAATATAESWPPTATFGVAGPMFVDGAGAETAGSQTTLTMPAHQTGDLLLMFAFNSNFSTSPSLPSGWTSLGTLNESSLAGSRVAYKFAQSDAETSGSWGSATNSLLCLVYRNVSAVGAVSMLGGNSQFPTINDLTLQVTDGSSWVVGMTAISNSSGGNLTTPPAGMVTRTDIETGNNCDTAGYDTNGGVTSWTSHGTDHTVGDAWLSAAIELKA